MECLTPLVEFDEGWPGRVIDLDRHRIQAGESLSQPEWVLICDVADELLQHPALFSADFSAELKAMAMREAEEIQKYFLRRLRELKKSDTTGSD